MSGGVSSKLSHGARFLSTATWSTTIPLLHSSISSLCSKMSTSRPSKPCVKEHLPLTRSWSSKMNRGSSWLSENRNADAAGLLLLLGDGAPHISLQRRYLCKPPSHCRTTTSKKKVVTQCAPSPPHLCLCWFSTFNQSFFCA